MRGRNGNWISFSQLHKISETCFNFNTIWRWHYWVWLTQVARNQVIGFWEEMYLSLPTQRLGPFQTVVCQKTAAGSTWTGWESNVCVLSLSISLSLCSARSSPPFFFLAQHGRPSSSERNPTLLLPPPSLNAYTWVTTILLVFSLSL